MKAQKLVELMMVSGVRTSSGFEERIRFKELEIVDRDAIDSGMLSTMPEGNYVNGWDVNVAGVRITSVKRNIRYHKHAVRFLLPCLLRKPPGRPDPTKLTLASKTLQEFLLRVKRKGELEYFVGRRYGDFSRLHKALRTELPGKVLPPLPKKNKTNSTASNLLGGIVGGRDSEASSISSVSTQLTPPLNGGASIGDSLKTLSVRGAFFFSLLFFLRWEEK